MGTWPGWWAGLIQLVCSILVLLGLVTRVATVVASGSMAYAYFVVHQPHALLPTQNGGVVPAPHAWTLLAIAVRGAGPWPLDALLRRRTTKTDPQPATTPVSTTPVSSSPDSVGPDSVGPDSVGPDSVGPDSVSPVSSSPDSATREPATA